MARWKLNGPHYLVVEGIDGERVEYIQEERNQQTGRARRRAFPVPLYLDPNDPTVINVDGAIVISDGNNAGPRDYIFSGEPTPDMTPLDDEAATISASLEHKWAHPIDSLPSNGDYAAALISKFESQIQSLMNVAQGAAKAPEPVSVAGVSAADFAKLQEQVALLAARNAELEAAPEASARR